MPTTGLPRLEREGDLRQRAVGARRPRSARRPRARPAPLRSLAEPRGHRDVHVLVRLAAVGPRQDPERRAAAAFAPRQAASITPPSPPEHHDRPALRKQPPDLLGGAQPPPAWPRPGRPPPRRRGRSGLAPVDRRRSIGRDRLGLGPSGCGSRGRSRRCARPRAPGSGAACPRRPAPDRAPARSARRRARRPRAAAATPPSASQRPTAVPRPLPAIAGGSFRACETTIRNASAPRPSATPRPGSNPGRRAPGRRRTRRSSRAPARRAPGRAPRRR